MAVQSEPPDSVFVGRERELGSIRSLLHRAAGGEAQALLVSGDAGVGKTALVARACATLEGSFTMLDGACLPLTSMSIPLLPIRSALRGFSGSVPPPDVAATEGEQGDFTLRFDAWLDRRCEVDPVVLVVDDLQWADRSTLDALMYLIAGPPHRRLAVIATLRSGEVGVGHPLQRWLADIRRLPRTAELALDSLNRAGTADQIQGLLATSPHQSLIDDVHRRSRGNPYFTRLMVAGLPPEARAAPVTFPADLSSAVLQSWYRLAAPTRHLATVLAVGGRAMHADELAEVVGTEDGMETRSRLLGAVDAGALSLQSDGAFWFHHPMNAEVLEAALRDDELRDWHRRFAELYEARLDGRALPVGTAVAIADHRHRAGDSRAAYEWALTAADAAGTAGGWAEQLRLLRRAVALRPGLPEAEESFDGLVRRLRAAAADDGATGDELEAVETLLARIDPDAEPLAASELMVRRMHLRFMTGKAFIELEEMREAVRLSAADTGSPQYALALAELAHAGLWNEDSNAAEHARTAVAVARGAGDPRALSHALTASSMAALIAEDGATAMRLAREAATLAIAAREWWAFVHATLWEANALEIWGSEAHASLVRARRLEMIEHGGPHAYVAWLSAVEAASWLTVGAWRECEERLRVALGSDPGPLGDVAARLTAARLATLQGRQVDAKSHLARAEELFADGSAFLAFEFDAVRAEVRLGSRDPEGAFTAALTGATSSGTPPTMCEWLMPLAARALADIAQSALDAGRSTAEPLAALDDLVENFPHVIRDLGPSTELWDRQIAALDAMYRAERARARASPDEADTWTAAVEACAAGRLAWEEAYSSWRAADALLGRAHDRQKGAQMLRHGLALAERLRARPVEEELRELATRARIATAEPAAASSEQPAALHGLTAREREILDHIAVGRTYSEIARTLMISEKTVSSHVSHLLAKTGTANRVELAGLVHRLTPNP